MTTTHGAPTHDDALGILALFLRLNGRIAEPAQLHQRFAGTDGKLALGDCVRALAFLGYETDVKPGNPASVARAGGPVITQSRDGRWLLATTAPQQGFIIQTADESEPRRVDTAAFEALGCRQCIVARPARTAAQEARGQSADAPPPTRFGIGWFWSSMKRHRAVLGEVLLASLFVQLLALLSPLIFQVVIDKVLTHRSMSTLDVMVLALLVVSLFEVALGSLRHHLFSHTTNRLDVELGAKLFEHLLRLPMSYFESRRGGDTVARVRELDNARSFLTGQGLTSGLDLVFAAVFLAVMFYYSPTLTGIVIASLPVFFAASWIVTPLLRRKLEDKFAVSAENQAFLVETVGAMETLKSQAAEQHWQHEWERRLADQVQAGYQAGQLSHATQQFIGLTSKLLTGVLLWFGAKLVIEGELSVGGLIAFNMLAGRVNAPILKLASLWQEFTQMKVSVKRLADIMDACPEAGPATATTPPPGLRGHVLLDRVTFSYAGTAPPVLSELSLEVQPGEIIGIVGVSGAGKTTLMRLIQRLHAPDSGRVVIDGIDINLVDAAWLRRQFGVVGQDTVLFNRSVRENIALGAPGIDMASVWRAARLAGAHEFILQLPQGYDTVIGERGSRLSGGQRARIAIARALVHDPRVLLLDEATASLDYESERLIHDQMTDIAAGRTVFVVAHRLSTMRLTHRIIVLERGRIVQTGTHAELMSQVGRYRALYHAHLVMETTLSTRTDGAPAMGAAHV
ncbi:MAG: type I secretion system permease/ATPase [Burkholderiales bacterium]|nr:MAG: type I secretion system permease/ATPase [Burkholderiales bacterium]